MLESAPTVVRVERLGRAFDIYPSDRARARHAFWSAAAHVPLIGGTAARRRDALAHRVWALRDVHFAVARGESVGIIGANGSGKSTLLHILCGTLSPTTGSASTQGRIAALLELGTGFVPDLTGRENVRLSGLLHGLDEATIAARAAAIAAFADIGEYLDQPVRTYSSGMYVRLAFAVMTHVDAEVLVVDEALAVGDIRFVQKCLAFLDRFRATGGTLLFVSHDLAAVRRLCTRVLWLDRGRLHGDGPPREVTEAYFDRMIGIGDRGSRIVDREGLDTVGEARIADGDEHDADPGSRTADRESIDGDLGARTDDHGLRLAERDAADIHGGTSGVPSADVEPPAFDGIPSIAPRARILDVTLVDREGRDVRTVAGGERVCLRVSAISDEPLSAPIVGFYVKDRLGQQLFGENTLAVADAIHAAAGGRLAATFAFTMPRLFPGEYLIAVALAEGTQAAHVHHEWQHEAWQFTSAWPGAATGLVGIDVDVTWEVAPAAAVDLREDH